MIIKKHPIKTVIVVVIMAAIGWSYRWTYTDHGRLDYMTALSLHALSFSMDYQPDPDFDVTLRLPVNLAFSSNRLFPTEAVAETRDVVITHDSIDVPARVYWPVGFDPSQPRPVIVYYHGGGFMLGDIEIFDPLARSLSNSADSIVISVGYRLTPAHPYPAAVDDSYAAALWAAEHAVSLGGDPQQLVVAGDSAGANLATVVALMARDRQTPTLRAQLLYYPAVDLTDKHYASYDTFGESYGLTNDMKTVFNRAYIGHLEDKAIATVSPLYADSLAGVAPALVLTAGFDLLTEPAMAYIDRLRGEGVRVTAINYPDTIHGFMTVPVFSQRQQGLDATRQFLEDVLP